MILLKNYLEAIEYKITDGTDYGWQCYGSNARYLDSYKEDQYSVGAIFDSQDQFVYAIELWDYQNNREYRWQHPNYKQAFLNEAKERVILSPLPGLSTHCMDGLMSPTIDWEKINNQVLIK